MDIERVLIAIPAYNEQDTILKVIDSILNQNSNFKILVINDGSNDSTLRRVKEAKHEIIDLPFNMGVGAAMRVAFKFAIENGFTSVLQIDADGQHDPGEINRILLKGNDFQIVIGSRFNDNYNYEISFYRRILLKFISKVVSILCKQKFTDCTSGFKLVSGEALEYFSVCMPTEYLGDTLEFILMASKKKFSIAEIPVKMNSRQGGVASQNKIRSMFYLLRAIFALFIVQLRGVKN